MNNVLLLLLRPTSELSVMTVVMGVREEIDTLKKKRIRYLSGKKLKNEFK